MSEIFNENGLHLSLINALTVLNFYLRKNQKREIWLQKKLPLQILVSFGIHFLGFEFGFFFFVRFKQKETYFFSFAEYLIILISVL